MEETAAGANPFEDAIRENDADKIRQLIAEGADVNQKLFHGRTPLMLAMMRDRHEIIDILLSGGRKTHV